MENSIESMLWDFTCVDNSIATENECRLVTDINGYNEQAFLDILYARTGLRSIEQAYDEGYWVKNELLDYYDIEHGDEI